MMADNLRLEDASMHWLKVCVLLMLTLLAMRATSWAVAWVIVRLVAASRRIIAIVGNVSGFATFVLLLYLNMLPGEPIDWAALLFGVLVFAIYTVTDFYWTPWYPRAPPRVDV